jgi:hypothetical protein
MNTVVMPFLHHVLRCCSALMVETEMMDLARLVAMLCVASAGGDSASGLESSSSSLSSQSIGAVVGGHVNGLEHFWLYERQRERDIIHFDVTKYAKLRTGSVQYKGLLSSALGGLASAFQSAQQRDATEREQARVGATLHFSTGSIATSLLHREEGSVLTSTLCAEAFVLLQVAMGDRGANSLPRAKSSGTIARIPQAKTAEGVVLDLLSAGADRFPDIADELYFQLVKQLTENPVGVSVARGWTLMAVYLHVFFPSADALPYLANFVIKSIASLESSIAETKAILQTRAAKKSSSSSSAGVGQETIDDAEG